MNAFFCSASSIAPGTNVLFGIDGVNDTAENLLRSIEQSHDEVSPSTIFAVASILEQ
jgi:hypothetical protein